MESSAALPSFTRLGARLLPETVAEDVAFNWVSAFAERIAQKDVSGIVDLFLEDAYWKDMLALTWDFRAFRGAHAIRRLLQDRLAMNKVSSLQISNLVPAAVVKFPDIAWVQGSLKFETEVGNCVGIFRLVPTEDGEWKAFAIYSNLDSLKGFQEKVAANRLVHPVRGGWEEQRQREIEFVDREPTVLVIGGGHNGLSIAARLKYMDLPTLVLEKSDRLGNQWRGRYKALCTHDPMWFTHLAYMPFPATWPVYTPGPKLADWLETYAQHLELDVWLSSELKSSTWDPSTKQWTAVVRRADGSERVLKPKHIIYAGGWNGVPNMPTVAQQADFKGKILHSSQYKDATDFAGKKVIVVGAGVSAHDIAQDLALHGADVTLHQRSSIYVVSTKSLKMSLEKGGYHENGLPIETADMLSHSFPAAIQKWLAVRNFAALADVDKEILEGLRKVGFALDQGPENAGFFYLVLTRRGGYYFDVGASQMIIDGKIKIKTLTPIESFTETGLKFGDGSELPADTVVFATGFSAIKDNLRAIFGDEFTASLKDPWYLDQEGELRAVWRDSGRENFWYMIGNLSYARFYSKRLALQIKAIEEGVFGTRYSLPRTPGDTMPPKNMIPTMEGNGVAH